ncbi:MAG: FKBP-type peptidyl-prolyl cis-trans isomerase [Bacteroidales bacterium]|nr:FKBP-type peptidyl-prolyl cis-trans isomerase [Bacteroidales bacterium]
MNRKSLFLLCTLVACGLYACSKNDTDERLAEEEQKLTDYITTSFPDAIHLGGSAYLVKTHEEPDGATIEAGNYILWNRKITNQVTDELEYTSDQNTKFADSYVNGGPELALVQSTILDEGLKHMRKGEKGDIYIPSRWLFFDFQPRVFSIEVVDVISKGLSVYQESLMSGYIKNTYQEPADTVKDVISTIDNIEYNVMYRIINEGTGHSITEGMNINSEVEISYLIREERNARLFTTENKMWNTNRGEKINTLTKTNCVGEILTKMKKGGKGGKLVIAMPSNLYWEDKNLPINTYGQYYIPRWSVVIFTITVK